MRVGDGTPLPAPLAQGLQPQQGGWAELRVWAGTGGCTAPGMEGTGHGRTPDCWAGPSQAPGLHGRASFPQGSGRPLAAGEACLALGTWGPTSL